MGLKGNLGKASVSCVGRCFRVCMASLPGVGAPQPLLGWQERVRLWTTNHEKEGPSLGVAEVEWAGHFLVGCRHEEPVI